MFVKDKSCREKLHCVHLAILEFTFQIKFLFLLSEVELTELFHFLQGIWEKTI